MTEEEIYVLVTNRVATNVPAMPVVKENQDSLPMKPYLTVDIIPTSRANRALSGGVDRSRGFVQITLVSETNEDQAQVLALAETIAAVFPHRLRLGDELLFTNPPMIEDSYRDGPDWRTPIRYDYQTNSQT